MEERWGGWELGGSGSNIERNGRCNNKAANAAVRGELGWWRMGARRDYLKLKYWLKILFMSDTRLVKKVYQHSKEEYLRSNKNNDQDHPSSIPKIQFNENLGG